MPVNQISSEMKKERKERVEAKTNLEHYIQLMT